MPQKIFLLLYSLALFLTACSSAGAIDGSRCQPASATQLEAINTGLHDLDSKISVKAGWWVQSKEFKNVRLVAAMLYGPGIEQGGGPGVWAMGGDLDNPAGIYSVDYVAKEFSSWGDAGATAAKISLSSDGVKESMWCAENKK